MIVLFTDFGWQGPYVGQMKAVLQQQAPSIPVIDLMHDAPSFYIKGSAYLLASLVAGFPEKSVFLAVVDPGVGNPKRKPCIIKADKRWYVGPDNGLFDVILRRAQEFRCWELNWRPEHLSSSFHGRDLFAPVAAQLARDELPDVTEIPEFGVVSQDWPDDLLQIIYIDGFGNAMTGLRAAQIDHSVIIYIAGSALAYAETFSAVEPGEGFWYKNSNGLVELAANCGSIAQVLSLHPGDVFGLDVEE